MLQSEALQILKMGKNVFLTGPAGSGKTHILNSYIDYLKKHSVSVAVTASTGIASTHLGGQTIHSWSGIGVKDDLSEYDIDELMSKQYLYKRYDRTKVLVIDEISMLHGFRLDLLEWVCRRMKRSEKSFGGIQVILCGDFFQLPPVTRKNNNSFSENESSDFAYSSESFKKGNFTICYLKEQHRQKDKNFLSILEEIRKNKVSFKTIELLKSRMNAELLGDSETTRLYTHNIDVDEVNKKHLDLIKSDSKKFIMKNSGSTALCEALKKGCLSPEVLELKIGAKVMFTKNHPEGIYVNGTLGKIEKFNSYGEPVVVTKNGIRIDVTPVSWMIEEDGKVKAEIWQFPLRLAWAITVHKSQGMSLDYMEVDLSKSFVRGMGYVAISRLRSLEGMKLIGLNENALLVSNEAISIDQDFINASAKASENLSKMSKEEIISIQNKFLKAIEPEEKIKIRKKEKESKLSTQEMTLEYIKKDFSLSRIANERKLKEETIISHIEDMISSGQKIDIDFLKHELKRSEFDDAILAFKTLKTTTLSPVFNYLLKKKKKPSFLKLRIARLFL